MGLSLACLVSWYLETRRSLSGFQSPPNFIRDPQQLLRRTRLHLVPPHRFISNLNLFKKGGSTPILIKLWPKTSTQSTLHRRLTMSSRVHILTWGTRLLSLSLRSSIWCKPTYSVGGHTGTPMPISNAWFVGPSPSRMSLQKPSVFAFSHSCYWERWSNCSTPIERRSS